MIHTIIKHVFALLVASIMLAACSNQPQGNPNGIVLNIEAAGMADNTEMIIMLGATQQPEDPIQKVTVMGGKAQFAFDVEGPRIYDIIVPDSYGLMQVVMDKGQVATLSVQVTSKVEDDKKTSYRYTDMKVTGQSLQDEFVKRSVDRNALDERYEAMHKITDKDEFEKAQAEFFKLVETSYKDSFKANADSWWGAMLILNCYTYITSEQEADYNILSDAAKQSFYGKILHDKIWPPSIIGQEVLDFEFTDYATQKRTSLYKCLEGKKYLLIDFWASWCKPCRKEIPNIKEQYKKWADKGFEVVSISADKDEAAWLKALKDEQLPWPNDIDGKQGIANKYKVTYYPTLYLIDSNHKVIAKDIKGEELANKLAELFK